MARIQLPNNLSGEVLTGAPLNDFLAEVTVGRAHNSNVLMRRIMESFRSFTGRKEINRQTIQDYLDHRRGQGVNNTTLDIERRKIGQFLKWCVDQDILRKNPIRGVPTHGPSGFERPIITLEQFRALLEHCDATPLPMRYLLTVLWYTGMRVSDACLLERAALNWSEKTISFTPHKTKRSGVRVVLPMVPELEACLRVQYDTAPATNRYVNETLAARYKRDPSDLNRHFRKVREAAALPPTVDFHCFRHTRTSRMANADIGDLDCMSILGLTSVETLKRYRRTPAKNKVKALLA